MGKKYKQVIKRQLSSRYKRGLALKAGQCLLCGYDVHEFLETHHVVPLKHGGVDDENNLVFLCPTCHAVVERLATEVEFANCRDVFEVDLFYRVISRYTHEQQKELVSLVNAISKSKPNEHYIQPQLLREPSDNARIRQAIDRLSKHSLVHWDET